MYNIIKLYLILGLLFISLSACKAETPPTVKPGETSETGTAVKSDSISVKDYTPGEWITNYKAALAIAKAENKTILMDFSGSDWCSWCQKLDREVFTQKAFIDYAKQSLVLLKLDFPRNRELPADEKTQNEALADQFEIRGFPSVVLLDKDGKTIGQTGYRVGGADDYVLHLKTYIK